MEILISDLLAIIADFLMQEPISYFVGIMLLACIVRIADYIMHGGAIGWR